jgi:hypothetical protein
VRPLLLSPPPLPSSFSHPFTLHYLHPLHLHIHIHNYHHHHRHPHLLQISIHCSAVEALEVVVTNDELGEYYEGDGADADADSPSDPASHGHGHSHSQGHGRHHFGASTLVVNGVKRKDGSSSSSSSDSGSGSGSGSVFECDLESVCRSHHDRAPQMVVKKRDGSNRDQQHADNENESGSGPGVDATTTYGIVGTKVSSYRHQPTND